MGDRILNCTIAVRRVATEPMVRFLRSSSFYETEPVGPEQPWFVNLVFLVEADLLAEEALSLLKKIERDMGRGENVRWGPRVIDLDILLFDDLVLEKGGLVIPHPEMKKRLFVLVPLAEVAPEALHPVLKKKASEMLEEALGTRKERVRFLAPPLLNVSSPPP